MNIVHCKINFPNIYIYIYIYIYIFIKLNKNKIKSNKIRQNF